MKRAVVAWVWLASLISVNLGVVILLSGSSIRDVALLPFAVVWLVTLLGVPLVLRVWRQFPARNDGRADSRHHPDAGR